MVFVQSIESEWTIHAWTVIANLIVLSISETATQDFIMADQKLGFFESFMLSGVAAGVSKTAAAPIERVKLLVQNQDEMIKQVSIKEVCHPHPIVTLRVVLTSHTMECLTAPSVCWQRKESTPSGEVGTGSLFDFKN